MDKEIKIIGLEVKQDFGALKAVKLALDPDNKLTLIKGEVGSGKTTLNKAMRLGTQGTDVLQDKNLYGVVDIETQILDGERNIFVGCKSNADGSLVYTLYEYDIDGKKVKNPVIDGKKATPAAYLSEMQTKLTWRLNELTSENPTTQRNLLLELYSFELEQQGVFFDKKSPKYVGGIIDQIEKAKEKRSYLDGKRKEVGGISDDLSKKGIDVDDPRTTHNVEELSGKIIEAKTKIQLKKTNVSQTRENALTKIKSDGVEIASKLKDLNALNVQSNAKLKQSYKDAESIKKGKEIALNDIYNRLKDIFSEENYTSIKDYISVVFTDENPETEEPEYLKELEFHETSNSIISDPKDWDENKEIQDLLIAYREKLKSFQVLKSKPLEEVDASEEDAEVIAMEKKLEVWKEENKITEAVEAFHKWKEANEAVNDLNKDYYLKLTKIQTGVKGLKITPEYKTDDKGDKIAIGNDIFLMYDGSYDPKYFANPKKELRKLSSYSDTQKPMICLLVQNYLLKKKSKKLSYLWIDQVPLDNKTRELLEKMSEELNLHLFVNWTGDFDKDNLQDGEILIENGEIFFN